MTTMIQLRHTILQLSIVVVIIFNFTTYTYGIDGGENTNINLRNNLTTSGNGNPGATNTTLNTNEWIFAVDFLKDDCLNDFIKTGRTIKDKFSQLVSVYNKERDNEIPNSSGRTFGLRKRIMSMALPLMFKFGVMFTVILTILALVIKSVIIGKIILLLNVILIVLKLVSLKKGHDGGGFHHKEIPIAWVGGGHGGWDTQSPQKEIHLHIHNNGGHQTSYESIPGGHANYGPYSNGPSSYGTISRSDTHPIHQTQQVLQKLVPYEPYSSSQPLSNEYILV